MEFHLFLPQMRMDLPVLVGRAQAAEAAGFGGIALMDHLAPPNALGQPMYEAMTTATWLAAHTDRLKIGHLVLCDAFREPAVLAKQAVTIDHASGGRFELGIGSGSVPAELTTFGIGSPTTGERIDRLEHSLGLIRALWGGEPVDLGDSTVGGDTNNAAARQEPRPLGQIPIVIGAGAPRMLRLVAEYAQWWNLPVHQLDRIDALRPLAGNARISVQQMVTMVRSEAERGETLALADRRFGLMGGGRVAGNGEELRAHFTDLAETGVERVYVWFTDFADLKTLAAFGEQVAAPLAT